MPLPMVQKENLKSCLSDRIQDSYPGEEMSSEEHGEKVQASKQAYFLSSFH